MPSSALPPLALYTLSLHDALPICAPANTVAPARQSGALSRVREDPLEEFVTVRPVRGASLGVAGALAAGLVIAPVGIATAAGSDGPSFYRISADSGSSDTAGGAVDRAVAGRAVHRATAKTAVAKKTQILQVID